MTTSQWVVVALGCMLAGMVVSRLLESADAKKPDSEAQERRPSDEIAVSGFRTLDQADVKSKRVLLRVDLNVPMENGKVTDATRLERVAPTIIEIADKGGKVILLAHFGRPKGRDPKESLKPVAHELAQHSRPAGRLCRRLHRRRRREGRRRDEGRRHSVSGEYALPQGRRKERSGLSSPRWRRSATFTSTTPSPPRIARTPRPKGSATSCPPMRAAPCRPNSTRCRRRWKRRRSR